MNNSKAPKIVVGVGLVAVYAAAFTILTLRDKPVSTVAPVESSAMSAQTIAEPAAPMLGVPESADTLAASEAPAAEAIAPAAAPAPVAPASNVAKAPAPEARRPAVVAAPRVEEVPVEAMPSPRPPVPADAEQLSRSNTGTNVVSEMAPTDAPAGESVSSTDETAADEEAESAAETPVVDPGNQ